STPTHRNQDSWSTSSASVAEPRIWSAPGKSWLRWAANASVASEPHSAGTVDLLVGWCWSDCPDAGDRGRGGGGDPPRAAGLRDGGEGREEPGPTRDQARRRAVARRHRLLEPGADAAADVDGDRRVVAPGELQHAGPAAEAEALA